MNTASFANHLLIAMPGMEDPNFAKTVTYLCEHNAAGALGIIVNRPGKMRLRDVFKDMNLMCAHPKTATMPIYMGGPIQNERGFVLHSPVGQWTSTLNPGGTIGVTTSRDILEAMAEGEGPPDALIALGYAGWGAGQLEKEILGNTWLNGPADPDVLFNTPAEERWRAAAASLGVDIDRLSGQAGHA